MNIYDMKLSKTQLGSTNDGKAIYLEPGIYDGILQSFNVYIGEKNGDGATMKLSLACDSQKMRIESINTPKSQQRKGYANFVLEYLENIIDLINIKLSNQNKITEIELEVSYSTESYEYAIDYDGRIKLFENHGFKIIKDNIMIRKVIKQTI